jgi:hypothetical protein
VRFRLRHSRDPVPAPAPIAVAPLADHDPAARGARAERGGEEGSQLSRGERAVARFNASEAAHTVAGLVRTLGNPKVSVGASAGAADEVRVTVAWELTWYQWGVDVGDEGRPVFELGNGRQVGEIDAAARQWNASTIEGGRIVMISPR